VGVRVPARARIPATVRDNKIVTALLQMWAAVSGDVRRWWLLAAAPQSLTGWLAGQKPARVPDNSQVLRRAWAVDNWTSGLLFAALSVVLFLAGGALRWLAGHPARRWAFLILGAACATYLWLA
jgi:hypothetical protein